MSKVTRIVAGIVLEATAVVLGIFGQWSLAFSAASTGMGLLFSPDMPSTADRQGQILQNRTGTDQALPVVYGSTQLGGIVTDMRVDSASTDRKRLVVVMSFCHGSQDGSGITAIDEVWFDDRKAIAGSTLQSPFSGAISGTTYLDFAHHLGTSTQAVDTTLHSLFPTEWPITSQGRGVCYGRYSLWYGSDVYPSGFPTIQAKVRGNAVYDPRTLTYAYSTNPALAIRDYLTSPIYGKGIPAAKIDDTSITDMANYCDELVTLPNATTQKRFEINGWVDTSRSHDENLAALCSACRGMLVNQGDMWRLVIRRARSVSGFKITESNTIDGSWQFVLPGSSTAFNVARAQYVDPAQKYQADMVQWPEPGVANSYLTADNSFEQRLQVDLPFTDNRLRAQQIGMTLLKESRVGVSATCVLKEDAIQCQIGDLVEVTQSTPGWTNKVFDILAMRHQPDGNMQVVMAAYDATAYDVDTQIQQPTVIGTNLPDPFTCADPTGLTLVSSGQALTQADGTYITRIKATWTAAVDPFIEFYDVQAKKTADTAWDSFGKVPSVADMMCFVYPVTDESWDVRVSAVNKLGVRSNWVQSTINGVTPPILGTPQVSAGFDVNGDLNVTVNATTPWPGAGYTPGFRISLSTSGTPSDATVDAETFHAGSSYTHNYGSYPAGTTVYIAVAAYSAGTLGAVRSLTALSWVTRNPQYVQCSAVVTSMNDTTYTVKVTATAPVGTPQVEFVAVTGGATLNSGTAAGTYVPQDNIQNVWVFNRAAVGGAIGQAQFRAHLSGYEDDDAYATIDQQGNDTVALVIKARVVTTGPTSVVVRVFVVDPFPQGANTVTLSYETQGTGTVSPPGVLTLTPSASMGTTGYLDFTVNRPAFGAGAGHFIVTGSAANREPGVDSVVVPEMQRDTIPARLQMTKIAYDSVNSVWQLWFRYYEYNSNGTVTELTNGINWAIRSIVWTVKDLASGAAVTPVRDSTYDAVTPGWRVTWSSTTSQAWSYHQDVGLGGQSFDGTTTTPTQPATLDLTIAASAFGAGLVDSTHGGTNQSAWTTGDMLYASATNTTTRLAGNATATRQFLSMASGTPAWVQPTTADIADLIGNVNAGYQALALRNLNAGASAYTRFAIGNNLLATAFTIDVESSTSVAADYVYLTNNRGGPIVLGPSAKIGSYDIVKADSGTYAINVSGNAGTVTNGVYTTGSYSNPAWITALAGSKISGNISGNANNITAYTINQNLGTANSPTFAGLVVYSAGQSNAIIQARGVGAGGNSFEWGHGNTAGYGSTIGTNAANGYPFIAFNAEAGTAANTYRTRGIKGSLLVSDLAGGFTFATAGAALADNQSPTTTATLDVNGNFTASNHVIATGVLRSTSTYGSVIGDIAGIRRIAYGSTMAGAFSLLTDTNSYAGLFASRVSATGGVIDFDTASGSNFWQLSSGTVSLYVGGSQRFTASSTAGTLVGPWTTTGYFTFGNGTGSIGAYINRGGPASSSYEGIIRWQTASVTKWGLGMGYAADDSFYLWDQASGGLRQQWTTSGGTLYSAWSVGTQLTVGNGNIYAGGTNTDLSLHAVGTGGVAYIYTNAGIQLAANAAGGGTLYNDWTISSSLTTPWVTVSGTGSIAWGAYHQMKALSAADIQLKSGNSGSVGLAHANSSAVVYGYTYGDSSGFGLLNDVRGWSVLCKTGTGHGGTLTGEWTTTTGFFAQGQVSGFSASTAQFAWQSGYKAVEFGEVGIMFRASASDAYWMSGVYYGTDNQWHSCGGQNGHVFTMSGAGAFSWYNTPATTAGAVVTLVQTMTLDASGNLTAYDFVLSSDVQKKNDIAPILDASRFLRSFEYGAFTYTDPRGARLVGFAAQDWASLPGLTQRDSEGYLTLAYERTIPVLYQGWRDHDDRIALLEAQVTYLEERLAERMN